MPTRLGAFESDVALLVGILRGEVTAWPADADPAEVLDAAERHGVAPLLSRAIAGTPGPWPPSFVEGLRIAARSQAALGLARGRELRRVLEKLHDGGVRALVIKGAHLASIVYESPDLRPRLDTDLLIEDVDRDRARAALEDLGYRLVPHISGALVMPQFHMRLEEPSGVVHQLDVHWRLAVPQAFSALPALPELWERSTAVPSVSPAARGPALADALVIACAHRAAHHSASDALIWIVDVQRIVERLSKGEAAAFVEKVSRARVRSVAGQALALARDLLGARLTPPLAMLAGATCDDDEPTAAYLEPVGRARGLAFDLRELGGWRPRARLLREHLLPSPAYMRSAYAPASRWPLPALYLRRAVVGAARWLAADRRGSR